MAYVAQEKKLTITKICLLKYTENFATKNENFQIKNVDFFLYISAQKIDCVYSLEPPRWGGSYEYNNLCFWAELRKIIESTILLAFCL